MTVVRILLLENQSKFSRDAKSYPRRKSLEDRMWKSAIAQLAEHRVYRNINVHKIYTKSLTIVRANYIFYKQKSKDTV